MATSVNEAIQLFADRLIQATKSGQVTWRRATDVETATAYEAEAGGLRLISSAVEYWDPDFDELVRQSVWLRALPRTGPATIVFEFGGEIDNPGSNDERAAARRVYDAIGEHEASLANSSRVQALLQGVSVLEGLNKS